MNFKCCGQFFYALLFVLIVLTGCKTDSAHSNLYFHKQELIRYHDNGKYDAEIKRIAERAMDFIRKRAASGEANLAVVLDIDETAVSTWDRLVKDDFARKDTMFIAWAMTNSGVAIEPMLNLYRETKKLGVKVFFITGRRVLLKERTEIALKENGYSDYDGLYLRNPMDKEKSNVPSKSDARKKISEQGFRIIANIGDQQSDLDGGFAERTFKLPNPFYYSP